MAEIDAINEQTKQDAQESKNAKEAADAAVKDADNDAVAAK